MQKNFENFTQTPISNPANGTEALFSFDAASRADVDAMAKRVTEAGGKLFAPPTDIQGWMYGCGFSDLDGHRWNALYMDMSKMPK